MSGNRTLVTRVTGGYTHHYTNTEMIKVKFDQINFIKILDTADEVWNTGMYMFI